MLRGGRERKVHTIRWQKSIVSVVILPFHLSRAIEAGAGETLARQAVRFLTVGSC